MVRRWGWNSIFYSLGMDPLKNCVFIVLFLLANVTYAEVSVGFLELRNWHGEVIQLEPDFAYAHVALKVNGSWIHAHPSRGVEQLSESHLQKMGKIVFEIPLKDVHLSPKSLQKYLGLSYDAEFSWSDEKIYCAELVAKLLGLAPSPMHFDLKYWDKYYLKYEGLPGSSPKKIYEKLRRIYGIIER